MLATLLTAAVVGVDACLVHVEVDLSPGLPGLTLVGLPDPSVRESRDRVRTAIRNSGFDVPLQRITVNLAPADLRKVGASFDLPIALGVLAANGDLAQRLHERVVVLGELSLDGAVQPARGVLPVALLARRLGIPRMLVARENLAEARVAGIRALGAGSLPEAVLLLDAPERDAEPAAPTPPVEDRAIEVWGDYADVRGQLVARRAIEIAAAGGHHILLVGPPGSGKTMLARRLPGILPPLSFEEALESTSVHSVAGLLRPGDGLLSARPFRAPHHTASDAALVGGGPAPRPGEITLAHNGVLFLDELPEFSRRALEALRQPLEESVIRVARAARTVEFPARLALVGAMNPCPCGYHGHPLKPCRCAPGQRLRYVGRVSGPLLDRFDLVVEVPWQDPADQDDGPGESSAAIRDRVAAARARQSARAPAAGEAVNARLEPRSLKRLAAPDREARSLLSAAVRMHGLSGRAHDRMLRVARTIADLGGAEHVEAEHVAEALQYRLPA